MFWFLPRLLVTLLALLTGGAAGLFGGQWFGLPALGALCGASLGVCGAIAVDAWRVAKLMNWLRSESDQSSPRAPGFWGELAYRIERSLRARDQQLQDEKQRLQDFLQAIQASPNGVLMLNESDQILWCNPVTAEQLGLDTVRDVGQAVTNLVRTPAFVAYLQKGDWAEPITFAARGGELTLQVLVRSYGSGQKLVVSQDVTERLASEAMRRDFVANVSHEIRTPLTVLAGFVETMASLELSAAERGRVLTLMMQQTERMRALVVDLLALAQLEGSPRPAADRWLPLGDLLQRVWGDACTLSAGRHTVTLDPDVPAVELAGAEQEVFSAVTNLATNAVRYTPDGGQIHLSARLKGDGQLAVDVRDNGIGIAREHLPRLTERFYRVDHSRARETGGTGLGLAIVKHVMQRHGGSLEVDSQPGKGSSFRLMFPAARLRSGRTTMAAPADSIS